MNRPILKLAFALVVFTFAVSTALADVKIKTKNTTGWDVIPDHYLDQGRPDAHLARF
jgi:hypothetical protein